MIVINKFIPNTAEGDYLCIRRISVDVVDDFMLTDQSGRVVYTMPVGMVYDEVNLSESGALIAQYDTDKFDMVRSKTSHATLLMLEQINRNVVGLVREETNDVISQYLDSIDNKVGALATDTAIATVLTSLGVISDNLVAYMQEVKKKIDEYADLVNASDAITPEELQSQLFVTFDTIDHKLQLTKISLGELLGESYTEQDGLTLNDKLNLLAENLVDVSKLLTTYVTLHTYNVNGTLGAYLADSSGYGSWSNMTCLLNNNLNPLNGLAGKVDLVTLQDVAIGSRNLIVAEFGAENPTTTGKYGRYNGFIIPVTGRYLFYNSDITYMLWYSEKYYTGAGYDGRGGIEPFEPLTLHAGDLVIFGRSFDYHSYPTDTQTLFFERLG